MDWLKDEINFPDWIPEPLREYVRNKRKRIVPLAAWKGETLSLWIAHTARYMELEKRLLITLDMKEVWNLFQKVPKKARTERMIFFIETVQLLFLDASDRHSTKVQKKAMERVKNLKRKVKRQIGSFCETIKEIDMVQGLHEQKEKMLSDMTEIEKKLSLRLNFSWKQIPSRIGIIAPQFKAVVSSTRRGDKDYVETVLKKGIPELFTQIFGVQNARLARIVSLVMLGKAVPKGEPDFLRNQVYDAVKSSRRVRKAK
jgi:hypothetical protein